ncbi:kinase-like domain-containing protein [Rhizophagus irregularis DAOM 181602=DAOM 197198]|nr:kinase-like domain-containing protein [Rhizophagus irregularis DAOM 181602=DAOM 197198]
MFSQNIPLTSDNILKYLETNFTNWTSGNEKIDNFIQERQLKINNYDDIVLEWIPYNQFNEIREEGKNGTITVYSAIWKDGPLRYEYQEGEYKRNSSKKVALKCLYNSQESINSLINEARNYPTNHQAIQTLYGISQNPDTGDYIIVQNNYIWTSGNEKIDDYIQERQLRINDHNDIVLEWIPYNQFNEIEKTGKNGLTTVYSAIWKDGPLYYKYQEGEYKRNSNKKVALKYLHNSQESINSLINEARNYPTNHQAIQTLYGISQNPDTGDYIIVQNNYIWISGNEKIDDYIQERQLRINDHNDIVLEWIPYNQFNKIEKTGKNGLITVYSAIWKDGPLYYKYQEGEYKRNSNKKVALKYLHNLQESIDFLINETKKYPTKHKAFYGISQNPDTGDYILVFIWTSGNEKIDNFIQERQLSLNDHNDIVLEWIPYNRFNEIKKIGKNGLITVYSAIWNDGPLCYKYQEDEYKRDSNKIVTLKCLYNSQESTNFLINEAKKYPTKYKAFQALYGISQDPDTGDYIFIQNNYIWTSGNEKIDDFIYKRQLTINNYNDIVLEWIPYNQFNEIKETGKNGLITVYSAIWKDGPLYYKNQEGEYKRNSNKKVALKYLHNSQESIDFLINEAKKYPVKHEAFQLLYGISQNPDTENYILVQNNYIWISENENIDDFIQKRQLNINKYEDSIVLEWIPYNQFNEIKKIGKNGLITVYSAIWKDESIDSLINEAKKFLTKHKAFQILYGLSQNPNTGDYIFVQNNYILISENKKIDDFIQKKQLEINNYDDTVLEWIPYNQFNEIKEIGKNGLMTVYSAIWKDGLLCYNENYKYYTRDSNKKVALKCLYKSQESIDFLINEAKEYPIKHKAFQVLYGISQNPDTGNYIFVQNGSINLANWTSGNEKIDDFIQKMQLKINDYNDIIFEWIPYSQFNEIKEVGKGGFSTVYSARWKDGLLEYDTAKNIYNRNPNKVIALKCLHNSQNSITDEFLNEVKEYSINKGSNVLNIYGISQNPDTKECIIVLQYAKEGNFNHWINENYKTF